MNVHIHMRMFATICQRPSFSSITFCIPFFQIESVVPKKRAMQTIHSEEKN